MVQLILHFCTGVCYIAKAVFLLIQALSVLRGLAEKAILTNLSWHAFGPHFVPAQTFTCTLLWQSKNDFSHLSWIYHWQLENEKRPLIPRRYRTWTGTTVTILASKLIKFTSVQLSPVDKPRSANPINHCLTHLPDLSLKLEKKLISSSPFQFCAPQPEDLFKS